jgi:hypothetical protein
MGGHNHRLIERRRQMALDAADRARQARCVETCRAWNDRVRGGGDPDPSPAIATALTAGFRWLQVVCPNCKTVGEVDLAALDRHPETPVYGLMPSLACKRCPGSLRMPTPIALSVATLRERAVR